MNAKRQGVRAERAADVLVGEAARRQRDAGNEDAEIEHVAAGRQRVDLRLRDDRLACRRLQVHDGGSPVTVIVSETLPTFMSALRVSVERPAQFDAIALDSAETGQGERHGVGAGQEFGDAILAAAIGDGRADFFDQRRARGLDGDAGQDGAGRVLHDARYRGAALGVGRPRTRRDEGDSQNSLLPSTHGSS